ncbi:Coq21p SPAR_B03260 [Saccharomyces paradoxus]|uniref:Coq21p n=1 Tax=Saccharomyces paradoxus TaxID=27291 RepID=A0A8B8UM18_SACPA|nr:uncharacterized protein SPAR_B03260 [Saccharomyces paradoxus]QHS71787.1 hypothetical protein SPAR_B03260 [Saccharomyces paradoxus]
MRNGLYQLWCVASAARGVVRNSFARANSAMCGYVRTSTVLSQWTRDRQWEAAKALSQRARKEHATN